MAVVLWSLRNHIEYDFLLDAGDRHGLHIRQDLSRCPETGASHPDDDIDLHHPVLLGLLLFPPPRTRWHRKRQGPTGPHIPDGLWPRAQSPAPTPDEARAQSGQDPRRHNGSVPLLLVALLHLVSNGDDVRPTVPAIAAHRHSRPLLDRLCKLCPEPHHLRPIQSRLPQCLPAAPRMPEVVQRRRPARSGHALPPCQFHRGDDASRVDYE